MFDGRPVCVDAYVVLFYLRSLPRFKIVTFDIVYEYVITLDDEVSLLFQDLTRHSSERLGEALLERAIQDHTLFVPLRMSLCQPPVEFS